ncbi:hypothetical protein [Hymenobacter psoromatis]|uniref:hypothetical protein n=1 Tax=Hymenobacter psoromatis TaxID=1484116 RepID=UPI001CBF1515|nr:hypothetical protein [Hymenobacter psoromatis]
MKKLSSLRELFNELEQLAEDQQGHLIGGFAVIGGLQMVKFEGTDNCGSSNCTTFCGGGSTTNANCPPINASCLQMT